MITSNVDYCFAFIQTNDTNDLGKKKHLVQFNKAMMNKQFVGAVNSTAYFSRIIR